jgi:hypothetical protein
VTAEISSDGYGVSRFEMRGDLGPPYGPIVVTVLIAIVSIFTEKTRVWKALATMAISSVLVFVLQLADLETSHERPIAVGLFATIYAVAFLCWLFTLFSRVAPNVAPIRPPEE